MKAKIIKTGEVIFVEWLSSHQLWVDVSNGSALRSFGISELEQVIEPIAELPTTEPDWEQRRWEASVAAMQGILANSTYTQNLAVEERRGTSVFVKILSKGAIEIADSLIEEFKKQKP